jgi:hypothetical protein
VSAAVSAGERFSEGDTFGGILELVEAGIDLAGAAQACFTGEMLLDVGGGKKRADAIMVGDRLWARPEDDPEGELALKEVEAVFMRVAPVWTVRVAGQVLQTTKEHPFWVEGIGWRPTAFLQVGDRLRTRAGRLVVVEEVADSNSVTTVYNWRIADYHTYYTSATQDGQSLWAHNADYSNELQKKDDAARKALDYRLGGVANDKLSAHHIIPWEFNDHPVVEAAARGGFNMNGVENGVLLSRDVHPQGFKHPQYSMEVETLLDDLHTINISDTQTANVLRAVTDRLGPRLLGLSGRIGGALPF